MTQSFTKDTPLDTDASLGTNSDYIAPSQKAVKAYVDNKTHNSLSGLDVGDYQHLTAADATEAVAFLNGGTSTHTEIDTHLALPMREILTTARTYYVRYNVGEATVSIATPCVVSKVSHGLSIGDAVIFSILPKMATCTITIASPGVVTKTGHGYAANQPIVFHTTGALPTGITAGTTYYVIATGLATDTFRFSTSAGGVAVNTSGTQSGTHYVESTGALPTGLIAGTVYYVISASFGANSFQVSTSVGGAAVNTSGAQSGIFNIATGDDANTGLTNDIAGALLTSAQAMTLLSQIDTAGYSINVQFADSKYLVGIEPTNFVGFGINKPVLTGNTTFPSNVTIDAGAAVSLSNLFIPWTVNGFRLQSSTGNFCVYVLSSELGITAAMEFGTAGYHLYASKGVIRAVGINYVIYKPAAYHILSETDATILSYSNTVRILDIPAFTSFVYAWLKSTIYVGANTWTGTATGKRYIANDLSLVGTGGQATTWLPGNVAGTTAGGGQYT